MAIPSDPFSSILWNLGFAICHQLPERSFVLGGYQMPMCARDTGIYLGFLAVVLFYVLTRRYRKAKIFDRPTIMAAIFGMALYLFDGASSYLGLLSTNNPMRLATGLLFGISAGLLLCTAASVLLTKGDPKERVFTWLDLSFFYFPAAFLWGFLVWTDPGVIGWYVLATVISIGFLGFFLLLAMLAWGATRGFTLAPGRQRRRLLLAATITEFVIIALLWLGHLITSGLVID